MGDKLLSWVLLIVLALIWGSSFILMNKGMFGSDGSTLYTSNQVAALRIFFASIFLAPIALGSLKIVNKNNFLPILAVGVCGNFLPAFLFTYAETTLNHSLVGVLNSTTPIFTILLGILFFQAKASYWHAIGIFVSTLGLFGLLGMGSNIDLSSSLKYIGAVLFATLCYATSVNTIKRYLTKIPPIKLTSLAFFMVLFPSAIILFFVFPGENVIWNNDFQEGIIYILILGIIGTSIAVILFNRMIQISSAIFASSVTYLIPIVALLWGVADGEEVNWIQVVSMLLIVGGVLIINWASRKMSKKADLKG
ncbi:MAG: DMT family transporter [Crocinitomicaceae bacterium]|nr:DMT family transporter [Crocinitomicaceae bacterium]